MSVELQTSQTGKPISEARNDAGEFTFRTRVNFDDWLTVIHGVLSPDELFEAWRRVWDRFPAVRAAQLKLAAPLRPSNAVWMPAVCSEEWQELPLSERKAKVVQFLSDRRSPATSKFPLRLGLFATGPGAYLLVGSAWSGLLDSLALQFFVCTVAGYASGTEGLDLPAHCQSGKSADSAIWKSQFRDFAGVKPLELVDAIAAESPSFGVEAERLASADSFVRFAREHRISLETLLQSAWILVLSRYFGEADVSVGWLRGLHRSGKSSQGEMDFQVQQQPHRLFWESQVPVSQLLSRLREQVVRLRGTEFMAESKVLQLLNLAPETQLYTTSFCFGLDPLVAELEPGMDTAPAWWAQTRSTLGLFCSWHEGLDLRLAYDPSRFAAPGIRRMLGQLHQALVSLTTQPEHPPETIRLLPDWERQCVLETWNATEQTSRLEGCVHDCFEQQAASTPNAVAALFDGESLTYAALNARANLLAQRLRDEGIGPDKVVGICLDRSLDLAVSVLAVLKAGGAYLPLDPGYPHDRLRFMLADSGAAILLTHTSRFSIFEGSSVQAICLDGLDLTQATTGNLARLTEPDHLAYVIYTSGSTGKPKGVAMVHRALVNLLDWQLKDSAMGPGDRTLQYTSLSFDVSFQEMFATWCSGGTLVFIPNDLRLDPRALLERIRQEKVARLFLPFVALQQLADAAADQEPVPLREIITAGEQLQITPRIVELCTRGQCRLQNQYGPSETHVVTAHTLVGPAGDWPRLPPIGRPIQNTTIYLLDPQHQPVPIGLPGELYIGGTALARGYLRRPEVTAEKFIPDLFSNAAGARLYRTGDLARYLPDGTIEFLGRMDHQVKIRGYRVELGEIESVLRDYPAVQEAVVTARETTSGAKQLVAYVVPRPGSTLVPHALRVDLQRRLPEHMVPSAFAVLERLPLTPSGKVDRRVLPPPENIPVTRAGAHVEPWLPIQYQLVQIWEDLLKVQPIGIRDNFFELGGDSILAARMIDQVERLCGDRISLTAMFQNATIEHLGSLLLSGARATYSPLIELQAKGRKLPFYFLHGDVVGGGFYCRQIARELGADQPFYVLPPLELNDGPIPSIEEMAAAHEEVLLAHRPAGPYAIGGFCIGAIVAYELARRLHRRGEPVSLTVLLDPQLPTLATRSQRSFVCLTASVRRQDADQQARAFTRLNRRWLRLQELRRLTLPEQLQYLAGKTQQTVGALLNRAGTGDGNGNDTASDTAGEPAKRDVLAAYEWAAAAYEPQPDAGPVALFLSHEQLELDSQTLQRWARLVEHLETYYLPGEHLSAITVNAHLLAPRLRDCLDRAQRQVVR